MKFCENTENRFTLIPIRPTYAIILPMNRFKWNASFFIIVKIFSCWFWRFVLTFLLAIRSLIDTKCSWCVVGPSTRRNTWKKNFNSFAKIERLVDLCRIWPIFHPTVSRKLKILILPYITCFLDIIIMVIDEDNFAVISNSDANWRGSAV